MVEKDRASRTAEGIAVLRAIESSKPEGERLFYDPYARKMIDAYSYVCSKFVVESGLYEKIWHGAREYVCARERYIDDYLRECLAEGFKQVVILGAGFDMRAFRIEGIEKTRVFEVDHPATQAAKLKKVNKIFKPIPNHVVFVSVDFNEQTLEERLLPSGYEESARTIFIWQGVTMYLTPSGVNNTLKFIAKHSAPGSAVIFDYFFKDELDENRNLLIARKFLKLIGEELNFGINSGQLEPFLESRGFTDVRNAGADDLTRLYYSGTRSRVLPGLAIGSGRVK